MSRKWIAALPGAFSISRSKGPMFRCFLQTTNISKGFKAISLETFRQNFSFIKTIYKRWTKSLEMKLIDYVNSLSLAYSFETNETVRVFKRGSRPFLFGLFFFVVFDLSKMVTNAVLNDNRVRFYISDFVCTWSKYQALFNYSVTVCYVFLIRLMVYLLRNENDESSKRFSYLNFLRISTEKELVKKHLFSKRAAKRYLFFVDLLIKITKLNTPLYFGGECSIASKLF